MYEEPEPVWEAPEPVYEAPEPDYSTYDDDDDEEEYEPTPTPRRRTSSAPTRNYTGKKESTSSAATLSPASINAGLAQIGRLDAALEGIDVDAWNEYQPTGTVTNLPNAEADAPALNPTTITDQIPGEEALDVRPTTETDPSRPLGGAIPVTDTPLDQPTNDPSHEPDRPIYYPTPNEGNECPRPIAERPLYCPVDFYAPPTGLACVIQGLDRLHALYQLGDWDNPSFVRRFKCELHEVRCAINDLSRYWSVAEFRARWDFYHQEYCRYSSLQDDFERAYGNILFTRSTMIRKVMPELPKDPKAQYNLMTQYTAAHNGGKEYHELIVEFEPVEVRQMIDEMDTRFTDLRGFNARVRLRNLFKRYPRSPFVQALTTLVKSDLAYAKDLDYSSRREALALTKNALYLSNALLLMMPDHTDYQELQAQAEAQFDRLNP